MTNKPRILISLPVNTLKELEYYSLKFGIRKSVLIQLVLDRFFYSFSDDPFSFRDFLYNLSKF